MVSCTHTTVYNWIYLYKPVHTVMFVVYPGLSTGSKGHKLLDWSHGIAFLAYQRGTIWHASWLRLWIANIPIPCNQRLEKNHPQHEPAGYGWARPEMVQHDNQGGIVYPCLALHIQITISNRKGLHCILVSRNFMIFIWSGMGINFLEQGLPVICL